MLCETKQKESMKVIYNRWPRIKNLLPRWSFSFPVYEAQIQQVMFCYTTMMWVPKFDHTMMFGWLVAGAILF
jgi:hypothetical protein